MKIRHIFSKLRVYVFTPFSIGFLFFKILNQFSTEIFFGKIISFSLILLGALLNWTVVSLNGFKMPVRLYPKEKLKKDLSPVHFDYTDPKKVPFHYLSDIYTLVYSRPSKSKIKSTALKFSIGDVFVVIGIFLYFIISMIGVPII